MSWPVFLLVGANLALIGALPRMFFCQGGHLNRMWWLTAAPFFVSGAVLILGLAGFIIPWSASSGLKANNVQVWLDSLAVPFALTSIALISFTLGTHRTRLALWHQDNDTPHSVVTHGAYARIRHPFYTAFIVGLSGVFIAFPHWLTLSCTFYAATMLNYTAVREERRLLVSEFGPEYGAYITRTGRFFPRIGAAQ